MQRLVREIAVAGKHRLYGTEQLGEILLLTDIPGCPCLHAAHGKMPGCLGRQHQYLDTGIIGGQPGDDLQAIKLGDADIQNDDVRAMLPRQLQRVHAVIRLRNDFITMPLHQHAYSQANDRMIIHDQHFIHGQIQLFAVLFFESAQ
ncbi:hypothetical protein D9M71_365640 [compost metagenome]